MVMKKSKQTRGESTTPSSDGVAAPAETKIVQGLRLLGLGRTSDTSVNAVLRLKVLGEWVTVGIPLEQTINARHIEHALAKLGFVSRQRRIASVTLSRLLSDPNRLRLLTISDGNGWYDDYSAYVFGRRVIGTPRQEIVILNSGHTSPTSGHLAMGRAAGGSWRDWQKGTHSALRHSDFLLSAVCFSLASTMASRFSKIESGLIHFHGQTSIGKTMLLIAAWSLFGPCRRELLPNWNTTPTGFEELLDVCTDMPFVCDELTFQAGASDASHNLKTASYAISSNRRKARSKHWAGGAAPTTRRGKTFVLSTGEESLATTRNTEPRRLGEQCRALDIAIRARHGVFRSLPKDDQFDDIVRRLEICCRSNYGHAGYHFIKNLILDHAAWPDRAEAAMTEFMDFANVPVTRLDRRFASRFALAYAAGLEARRCRILGVSRKRIARSLRRAYRSSSHPILGQTAKVDEVLATLRTRFQSAPGLPILTPDLPETVAANAEILVREESTGENMFMVSSDYLIALCGSKEVWKSVVSQLRRAGHLLAASKGLATRQISIHGTRRRFLCVKSSFLGGGNQ